MNKDGTDFLLGRRAFAALASTLLLLGAAKPAVSAVGGEAGTNMGKGDTNGTFSRCSTIGEIVRDPAFKGFGEYVLPLETLGRPYRKLDEASLDMPLTRLPRLLPYHTNVNVDAACGTLNRLKARSLAGDRVWIPLSHDGAGLFFYPALQRPSDSPKPFVLIAAGGGFVYVGSIHEGFPYAEAMNKNGMNAFVLQYRVTRGGSSAMEDMAEGLDFILSNTKALNVDPKGYALMGSSAGARMAAWLGSIGLEPFGYKDRGKAGAVLMAYTGHSDWQPDDPPTFMVQGTADPIAPVRVVDNRVRAMREVGIPVDYMRVDGVAHGFGLGTGTAAEGWIDRAARFWAKVRTRN